MNAVHHVLHGLPQLEDCSTPSVLHTASLSQPLSPTQPLSPFPIRETWNLLLPRINLELIH
jgi:hypothetical protein